VIAKTLKGIVGEVHAVSKKNEKGNFTSGM
jgi:hypothetical protein